MQIRKLSRRGRVFTAAGTVLGTLVGMVAVAPVANADVYTSYTLQVAAEGTRPVAPRFFEGFGNTINVAGSETAEYALEQVGALYNNAGIFGCNLNSGTNNDDKRTCNLGANAQTPIIADAVLPSTDIYDNFDHNVVNNAQAVGSAAGVSDLCNDTTSLQPTEPSSIPATWPYYTYPVVPGSGQTFGALGIPIDLVRASASIADLGTVGVSGCSDLLQQGIASDAVVGLSFNPAPSGVTVTQALPPGTILNFTSVGGANSETDTAWRVFCAPASSDLSITTWDQLAAVEGFTGPTPDQPIVLWGPKNNSGTGATWYTFSGCTSANPTGRVPSTHLITENDAQQLSLYAAQNSSQSISLNTAGCPSCVTPIPATTANPLIDNCGGNGTTATGLGTSSWSTANEQCVAQEVADSLFFMSYGYYSTHTYTAAVTIPTGTVGSSPDWILEGTPGHGAATPNYEVVGTASKIGGVTVTGAVTGQPGAGVPGDARSSNTNAVLTGRDLWLFYLSDHVRASAAGFVNWVCDAGNEVAPKGLDVTTGVPLDTEITNAVTAWGFGRLNCDSGSTTTDYGSTITTAVIDPGPPNNE